jgi:hypothetical protein
MPKFVVTYTFGASIIVEAEDADAAEELVEEKPTDELLNHARDGFELLSVARDGFELHPE